MNKPAAAEGAGHPAPTEMSIEDHVALHGPAHKMDYTHDKASGDHHVTSHHGEPEGGDEKQHHSVHKTAKAAHEHMGKSMGMDHAQEEKDEESPDQEGQEELAHTGGGGIPGLS